MKSLDKKKGIIMNADQSKPLVDEPVYKNFLKNKPKYHCNPLDPDSTLNASNRVVNSQVINEELGLKSQLNNTQSNKYQEIEESFIKYCSDFIINLSYTDERYLLSFISSLLQKQKEQILNLECLKEEEPDEFDDFIGTDRIETKNKLRNQIKSEIEKICLNN